jgi:hypothetical protein
LQGVLDDIARRKIKVPARSGTDGSSAKSVTLSRAINSDGSTKPVDFRRTSSALALAGAEALAQADDNGGLSAEDVQQQRVQCASSSRLIYSSNGLGMKGIGLHGCVDWNGGN